MEVQVKKVRKLPNPKGAVKGYASVSVGGLLDVNDLSVVEGKNGWFVGMPYREYELNGEKKKAYFVWITDEALRSEISEAVLAEYNK